MTTVTLDTLSNSSSIFIRNVLRSNLTDRQGTPRAGTAWIFKGQPEELSIDYPFVILNIESKETKNIGLAHSKRINTVLTFGIEIWANKMVDKDILSDRIEAILSDPTSTDGTDSIKSKRLHFKEISDSDEDSFKTDTELVRLKMLSITFRYGG